MKRTRYQIKVFEIKQQQTESVSGCWSILASTVQIQEANSGSSLAQGAHCPSRSFGTARSYCESQIWMFRWTVR